MKLTLYSQLSRHSQRILPGLADLMMEPDMLMDDDMGSDGDDVGLDRDKDDGGLDVLLLPAKRLRLAEADEVVEGPELDEEYL